jgi:carbamoyltransferase
MYSLGINPTTEGTGSHDPSAILFDDGEIVFGAEEERFNREKHAMETFPDSAVRAALEFGDLALSDLDAVSIAWQPRRKTAYDLRLALKRATMQSAYNSIQHLKDRKVALAKIENRLSEIGTPVPPIETRCHHRCHAASALYPSGFDQALVLTLDGRGERDTTVVWKGDRDGLERLRTYKFPNSWGGFYGAITTFLGYRPNNGEGKVMGLAPYGTRNQRSRIGLSNSSKRVSITT